MKKVNKKLLCAVKKVAESALVGSANSTSSVFYYQPKAPNNLRKFSKVDNDK